MTSKPHSPAAIRLAEIDELVLDIEKLVAGGEGFGRYEGIPIFVPRSAPGDRLRVRVTDRRTDYGRAEIIELLEPGPGRRPPPCPHFGSCGGCDLQHLEDGIQTDLKAEGVKAAEAPGLLHDGRIDAFFYTVGHPSGAIKEATSGKRKVHLVPITDIDNLLANNPYYAKAIIPIKLYPGATNKTDVVTFGVKATFVTSAKVPDDVVYAVTREIFENLDEFKGQHPAFAHLTAEGMLKGLSAPIHPGAMKYFREAGLKK